MKKKGLTKEVIAKLRIEFPDIEDIRDAQELGYSTGIHLGNCAEGGTIDGAPACDYYAVSNKYIFGVHPQLWDFMAKLGYFVECQNPGTYIAIACLK